MNARFTFALLAWLSFTGADSRSQTLNLPPRLPDAPTGSQFISIITPMSLTQRENWIYAQVVSGNVPDFLRTLVPITVSATISGTPHTATYYAAPDYVVIGTDTNYFLEPMTPLLGQRLCNALGCSLPTRKMVKQIWTNATVKLTPVTFDPSVYDILSVAVFSMENNGVGAQRNLLTNSYPLGALVSGDKKDVVISTMIYSNLHSGVPKPVVIYGWQYPGGSVIQPLFNGHEETYADYSHGIRLVQMGMTVDGAANTVTNVLTNPGLAALLSDEGPSEGTTASGVILVPRYPVAAVGAVITTPPRSQTVPPGATVSFRALAAGDPPLNYRWQSNGVTLAGAANASLVLSNVQAASAANYTVFVTNSVGSTNSRPAVLRVSTNAHPVLFADNFDTNTSASWTLFWAATNGIPDYTANWAFDYGGTPYSFNGFYGSIPPAPNSPDGSTRGVRLTVNNNDANAVIAAVNIYPRGQSFSKNFALKFDLWINYPGNAGGTGVGVAGSTEHAIFGINHLGIQINWAAPSAASSDGLWFGADGEGGESKDYRAYAGNLAGTEFDLTAAGTSGLTASNNAAASYQTLFPAVRFETPGSPGKTWVEVEVRQTNNFIFWTLDGTVVAQRTNTHPFTAGDIMLGYMDTFNSIASPAQDAFVLFDNVRVEDLSSGVRFLSASILANHQAQLTFSAVPGQVYVVEGSTNLVNWSDISTLSASNGPLLLVDPQAANFTRRFYRAHQATP